jgi:hypothetical protein
MQSCKNLIDLTNLEKWYPVTFYFFRQPRHRELVLDTLVDIITNRSHGEIDQIFIKSWHNH